MALHTVVLVLQVAKKGGVSPLRETLAKGSELPGHEGKRRGRHCTGTGRGAAQSVGSALLRLRHAPKQRVLLRLSVAL